MFHMVFEKYKKLEKEYFEIPMKLRVTTFKYMKSQHMLKRPAHLMSVFHSKQAILNMSKCHSSIHGLLYMRRAFV